MNNKENLLKLNAKEYIGYYTEIMAQEFPDIDFNNLYEEVWDLLAFWGSATNFEKLSYIDKYDFLFDSLYFGNIDLMWYELRSELKIA